MLDSFDYKALRLLMTQGRASWADLAKVLGLSPPAAAERVRRLEERGAIRGYAALVDPDAIGCGLASFIIVTMGAPEHRAAFLKRVDALPEIQECHHVTGDGDFILKVRCRDTRELERLISEELKNIPGITSTHTTIVLRTHKETPVLPLPPEPES